MGSLTCFALFLAVWTVCGQATCKGTSTLVYDFMSGLNGDMDNRNQIMSGSREHDYIQARFIPVEIAALGHKQQLYMEGAVNGEMVAMHIAVVSQEDLTQDIITLTQYNFTDFRKHDPREFNVKDLDNLTLSDLHTNPECKIKYVSFGNGTFFGLWPTCKNRVNQRHPAFTVMATCDAYAVTVPLSTEIRPASVPYLFQLKSQRYPLKNRPPGYVSPCEKKRQESD